jgi:hypothetical protein
MDASIHYVKKIETKTDMHRADHGNFYVMTILVTTEDGRKEEIKLFSGSQQALDLQEAK